MLYKRKEAAARLCVLRVSTEVRHIDGVVITDRNASSKYVRFLHPSQAHLLDYEAIFAVDWWHPDQFEYFARKSKKCAEILIPHCVEPRFLTGAYAVDPGVTSRLKGAGFDLPVAVEPGMFFC